MVKNSRDLRGQPHRLSLAMKALNASFALELKYVSGGDQTGSRLVLFKKMPHSEFSSRFRFPGLVGGVRISAEYFFPVSKRVSKLKIKYVALYSC